MGKLDRLIKSVASLDVDEQKAILKALDVYEDDQPVEEVEPVVEEEQVPVEDTETAASTPTIVETTPTTEPQGGSDIFAALQAQLNDVMNELKGLKETKEILDVKEQELEEKVAKQPFGLHGKVQTKDTEDSSVDVEKMYSQNLKRY